MRKLAPRNVRPYDQHQCLMFPPSIKAMIPEDDLCFVIDDAVRILDLTSIYQKVSHQGNPPYHPAMMVKVLFYAYAMGIFSSRRIARAVREHVPMIYLAAWQQPDFRTISDFRKNHLRELDDLFVQIVVLCRELGMVKLGHVSIDGTKMKASASDAKTYDRKRIKKEIKRLLEKAAAEDLREDELYGKDKTGDELPEEIRDSKKRIEKLRELKKRLDEENREKINKTDPDAVFMKTTGGIKTAYNAQVAADGEHQVIVACDVTRDASDVNQLLPMIEQAEENVSGKVDACSADSGYSSGENLQKMESLRIDTYIPDRDYQARKRGKEPGEFDKCHFVYDEKRDCYICPEGSELVFSHLQERKNREPLRIYQCAVCTSCQFFGCCTKNRKGRTVSRHPFEKELAQMRVKLDTSGGREMYSKRKHIVEPVFGHIKSITGFRDFRLRGLSKVNGEFKLVAIAHNLRKIGLRLKKKGQRLGDLIPNSPELAAC